MVNFLNELTTWILYFFIYSIIGWVFESTYCSLKAKPPHFINRGFLFGPLCPIYGSGLVAVAFLMQPFTYIDPVAKFLIIAGVCTVIEYVASFVMEKLYHVRWWSYRNSWYNFTINGRVSFWTSIGFGLGGLIVLNYIHPSIVDFVGSFSFGAKMALSVSLIILFMLDNYMSNAAAASVKHALKGGKIDLTDEIKRYAINYYREQTRKTRRLAKKLLKQMKKAQKTAIKQLRGAQKRIMRQAAKLEYRAKRHEVRKEIAKTDLKTIPRKTERLKKNSKF
ncbi:hypothetical protein IJ768_03660 [Candidatus Saccharibacteria bacterium]|nr:hypothetical protein [Candidatus Saccharibacteria bacterium]